MNKLLIFLLFTSAAFGADKIIYTNRTYEEQKKTKILKEKTEKIEFQMIDNLEVSSHCFTNKSCMALLSIKKVIPKDDTAVKEKVKKTFGNPGSALCLKLEGKNIILTDSENKEYDFCVLKDGSVFNSWQMHDLKFPNTEVIK